MALFDATPAIVLNQYGDGRTALFAFDLAAMLRVDPTLVNTLLRQVVTATVGQLASTPSTLTVGDVAVLQTDVTNRGTRSVTLELRATIAAGVRVIGSVPEASVTPATETAAGSATLRVTLQSGEALRWLLQVQPTRTGALEIPVAIYSVPDAAGATPKLGQTVVHTLLVQAGQSLFDAATAAVDNLQPTRSSDASAKRRAQDDIRQAKDKLSRGEFDEAIGRWIDASDEVARISSVPSAQQAAALKALALAVEAATDQLCGMAACIGGTLQFDAKEIALGDTLAWSRSVRNACSTPVAGIDITACLVHRSSGREA